MAKYELQIFEPAFDSGVNPNSFRSVQDYNMARSQWANLYSTPPPVDGRLTKPPANATGNWPVIYVWYKFPRQLVARIEGASVNPATILQAMELVESMEFSYWALPPQVFQANGDSIPSSGILIGSSAGAPPVLPPSNPSTPSTPVGPISAGSGGNTLKWVAIGVAAFIILK